MIVEPNTIYAAGTVCWREGEQGLELLVIHRTVQQDLTFPKGKVDPGETLTAAAVRETWEETGLQVNLGVPLGKTRYSLTNGKTKEVHYWCAEVSEEALERSTFVSNDEVESVHWLPVDRVAESLTYDLDREVFFRFLELAADDALQTFAIILLRHATALDASTYLPPDQTRPLATRGRHQAEIIVEPLLAFGPRKLVSSSSIRCRQTIEPLALATGKRVRLRDEISQHRFLGASLDIARVVQKRIDKAKTTVICSHGPVLPELLNEVLLATNAPMTSEMSNAIRLDTAAFMVLHLRVSDPTRGLIAWEAHDPLV